MVLYHQLQQEEVIIENKSESVNFENPMIKLNEQIAKMMVEYRQECASMNMIQ